MSTRTSASEGEKFADLAAAAESAGLGPYPLRAAAAGRPPLQPAAEVVSPPKHLLGSFLQPGQCDELSDWLRRTVQPDDQLLVSNDMLG